MEVKVLGATKHGDYQGVLEYSTLCVSLTVDPASNEGYDVLIQVAYSDVNPVDLQKLRGGKPGTPARTPPFVPGNGGSGTVVEVGTKVSAQWKGKDVCFLVDPSRRGSYASHVLVDSRCVALLPSYVDLKSAASIPVAGLTAFEVLTRVGFGAPTNESTSHIPSPKDATKDTTKDPTKTLLVIGGAGGVGSWILTLARAWYPNLIILATASSEAQQKWCHSLGATQVFRHDEIGTKLTTGREGSVDTILCLTEPTQPLFDACAEVIRPYGHIGLVVAGKGIESLNLGFCFFKGVTVALQTVFTSIRTCYQTTVPAEELAIILNLLAKQTIRAPLSPDLNVTVSDAFGDAMKPEGVLYAMSQPHGRRGKFVLRVQADKELIFLDMKTACLLKIPMHDCVQAKILHTVKQAGDNNTTTTTTTTLWKEQAALTERDELIKKISLHPTLGVLKVAGKQCTDYEDGLAVQEAENVKSLWGVELKKRARNAEGEELLFLDPTTGALGELSRVSCIQSKVMVCEVGKNGQETIQNAIGDDVERDDVIQMIRKALKLNLEGER